MIPGGSRWRTRGSSAADGLERDFQCTQDTCICEVDDLKVKSVAFAGHCTGSETLAEVWELASSVCGWNVMPTLGTLK